MSLKEELDEIDRTLTEVEERIIDDEDDRDLPSFEELHQCKNYLLLGYELGDEAGFKRGLEAAENKKKKNWKLDMLEKLAAKKEGK